MQTELQKTERELKIKNYSAKTIKSYLYGMREYFSFKGDNLTKLDQENIRNFLLHCERKQISPQSRNLFLNAIKFYYRNVMRNPQKIEIQSAKKPKSLPVVLSRSEIGKILESLKNPRASSRWLERPLPSLRLRRTGRWADLPFLTISRQGRTRQVFRWAHLLWK